ncbi:Similar to ATP binding / alanine-tRNA ligase [Ectocarpus siliculosus]|uniref:Similar to ATP binding / alanine-tRNA ligase n=1 Tax=Ectocarpus siliculosus TaxID=2880 RepID=D7FQB2_ECTSI|nr:Similar to ATP binding / alanine-tRNA ligase [Ectocarpus siliculosus]|eukprot:CBJ48444.1 Similar to ATP binding / alanine-tRNA ligase [Ectocarpus siliculosus]
MYLQDTYLMTSEATVLGVVEDDSQGSAIILDRTIFHPQGGGQPSDEGTITCGDCTVPVSKVRDVGGVIYHYGTMSGTPQPRLEAGRPASLALDSAKRLRHAALHSAGHAVDKAVVGAVGAGVFSPLKGYHFDDSPYVEYRGTLPAGLEKDAFIEKCNSELDKLVMANMETMVKMADQEHGDEAPSSSSSSAQEGPSRGAAGRGREEVTVVAERGGRGGRGKVPASSTAAAATKYGAATRTVTVAGLSCPCGGTHVRSTREMEGVRITKVKAKKGTLRVSYTLAPSSSSSRPS